MEITSRFSSSIWRSLTFFGLLGTLIFIHVFITYKGLKSPAAMEQAHVAKQLASGNGFTTKALRPFAQYEMHRNGRPISAYTQPDLTHPPLPSLVLAPVMLACKDFWEFKEGTSIYFLDRVVTAVSILFYLGALVFIWLSLFRVFDGRVAGWTLMCLVVSNIFWQLATHGIAQMMTLCFFSLAVYLLTLAVESELNSQKGSFIQYLLVGITLGLAVLCNYYVLTIVIGASVSLAIFGRQKVHAVLVFAPSVLALFGVSWWYMKQSGQPFGMHYATLKSAITVFSDEELVRTYGEVSNMVNASFLGRKILTSIVSLVSNLYSFMGGMIPALFFFVAVLHPFRNPVTSRLRWILFVTFLIVTLLMSFIDLPDKQADDRQVFTCFAPVFAGFGVAFIFVMWSRQGINARTWLASNAGMLAAFILTAIPLLTVLPLGITLGMVAKGQLNQYPEYVADRIRRLDSLVKPDEVIFADAPWATAWYADRSSYWLPVKISDFDNLFKINKSQQIRVAGIYLSPISAKVEHIGDAFQSNNLSQEWNRMIFRGYAGAFGVDTMANYEFPFKISVPIVGKQVGEGRFMSDTSFLTDKIK